MRTSKIMGVVAAGLFTLTLGAQQAGASTTTPHGISQVGGNDNHTTQTATSKATTEQGNLNRSISFFTVGSNDGGVRQSNGADTSAKSTNDNATYQQLHQTQNVPTSTTGKDGKDGKHRKHGQDGKHSRKPACHDRNRDEGKAPLPGDGDKRGDSYGKGSSPAGDVSQRGGNDNRTSQDAESKAKTEQANVNVPISVFSVGSNDENVTQGNWADTSSDSSNGNSTDQSVHQSQWVPDHMADGGYNRPWSDPKGDGKGDNGDVSQSGSNRNSTDQTAKSTATTKQANINAPISLFSVGSNDGDVRQSNGADTSAKSSNANWTGQSLNQDQSVSGDQGSRGNADVSQSGSNRNSTDQTAKSTATTKQLNVNAPISLFSVGSNDGGVQQGNSANTHAGSSNANGTQQVLGQGQSVGSLLGL